MTRRTSHRLPLALAAAPLVGLPLVPGPPASGGAAGAVSALTNSPAGNAVVAYQRGADGSLTPTGSFPTGGMGMAGLSSQGAVIVSDDHQLLFAVNAGSNSISSFRIRPGGLELADTAASGGTMPISVAFFRGLLYVLNVGVPNNISGFTVDKRDTLFVSEAGAGGGASSYRIGAGGSLTDISPNVMTGQSAACWAVVTKNGRYGYVANAGTGNISGFAINQDGLASLLDLSGVTAMTGGNPTDIAISHDSIYLYTRVAALA